MKKSGISTFSSRNPREKKKKASNPKIQGFLELLGRFEFSPDLPVRVLWCYLLVIRWISQIIFTVFTMYSRSAFRNTSLLRLKIRLNFEPRRAYQLTSAILDTNKAKHAFKANGTAEQIL